MKFNDNNWFVKCIVIFAVLLWNKSLSLVRQCCWFDFLGNSSLLTGVSGEWSVIRVQTTRSKEENIHALAWTHDSIWIVSFIPSLFVKTNGRIKTKEKWETSWRDFNDVVNTNTTEVTTLSTGSPGTRLRCIFGGVVSDWHFDRHVEKPIETLIVAKRAGTWSDQVQDSSLEQLGLISALKWWSNNCCLGKSGHNVQQQCQQQLDYRTEGREAAAVRGQCPKDQGRTSQACYTNTEDRAELPLNGGDPTVAEMIQTGLHEWKSKVLSASKRSNGSYRLNSQLWLKFLSCFRRHL